MARSQLDELKDSFLKSCERYLDKRDLEHIAKAKSTAKLAHKEEKRYSGEPYYTHPLSVATKLCDLNLDKNTVIAGLLHDALEDTELKREDIRREFGPDVLSLVEGVTKLGQIRIKKGWFPFARVKTEEIPEFERQLETLRKMLIAMSKDVRVVLIKLADRMHNLETLQYLPEAKRERYAREALEIFAPIAERLGMGELNGQINDLAFSYLYPEDFKRLKDKYEPRIRYQERIVKVLVEKVKRILRQNHLDAEVNYRIKHWYSLFKKLNRYEWDDSKIYDLVALRIVVKTEGDCYKVLGLIHKEWKPLIGRIKDFIAFPKPNGYRSIHTTVIADKGAIVEFQIRTEEMHHQAEFGIAAHWIYKNSGEHPFVSKDRLNWVKEFSSLQRGMDKEELARSFDLDLFQDRIFVFTPEGDVKDMPKDSTPVDFAYYVHTWLGDHCAGAKINGKIAPLSTPLKNGDIVEILDSKSARPRTDWLKFVKTHVARSHIRREIRSSSGGFINKFSGIRKIGEKFRK